MATWQKALSEYTEYETPDGSTYPLVIPSRRGRWVITETGWGVPDVEHVTQRSPLQHGNTIVASWLRPRTLQLIIRQDFCSRNDYWEGRKDLVDALRMDLWHFLGDQVRPGILRKVLPDGSLRELDVYLGQGPTFDAADQRRWQQWSFQEILRFVAYDPIIRDPIEHSATLSLVAITTVTYDGTWAERPVMVITGPCPSGFTITNSTTGESINIVTSIADGETVTIDLTAHPPTVISDIAGSLIANLSTGSHLATWHLAPHPEAINGDNSVFPIIIGSGANTSVTLHYKHRYWAI